MVDLSSPPPQTYCGELSCVPQNSSVEALTPNVTVFGNVPYKEVVSLNKIIRVGP